MSPDTPPVAPERITRPDLDSGSPLPVARPAPPRPDAASAVPAATPAHDPAEGSNR